MLMTSTTLKQSKIPKARRAFVITGQVQGVGFRPAVYRMAEQWGLSGFVRNTTHGVELEAQGSKEALTDFTVQFQTCLAALAPMARIELFSFSDITPHLEEHEFVIVQSEAGPERDTLISPDIATCPACLADILTPSGRRYHYPFANCTNCGPRYTIIRDIPYDRPATTMACFPLCPKCAEEFKNPQDRRFHAQPNACPVCGPHIYLTDETGTILAEKDAALDRLTAMLLEGKIAAIKGLGGFHLSCVAQYDSTVTMLRKRKYRPNKPFAVMVRNSDDASRLALLTPEEKTLLENPAAPIVLCRKKPDSPVSAFIAPDTGNIGLMLPSTPLHHLLFNRLASAVPNRIPALVMTSGNKSGFPIAQGNREALRALAGLADCFLLHNRDIVIRIDDSVVRQLPGENGIEFFRRARGYTPRPIVFKENDSAAPSILALGAELKNTICLTRKNAAFVSQHIGDLESLAVQDFFRKTINHFLKIFATKPDSLVCDLHPDYHSSVLAREIAAKHSIPLLSVQHHAAHIYSVLAEHNRMEKTLGLALDGTGLGHDRTIWGGELLLVDPQHPEPDCRRLGHIMPMPLPGGDAAAREPWRMTLAFLHRIKEPAKDVLAAWGKNAPSAPNVALLQAMLEKNIQCPKATSCGRLFDAVFGLLGAEAGGAAQEYEGQAAVCLETLMRTVQTADPNKACVYAFPLRYSDGQHVLDTVELFRQIFTDWKRGTPPELISWRFHVSLTKGLASLAKAGAVDAGIKTVALSGGVLQNSHIRMQLPRLLLEMGLNPLLPLEVPANDGGLSLGQAFWGLQVLKDRRS